MFNNIKKIFVKENKKYRMPSRVGFIVWTDEAIKNNLSIKTIKITLDEFQYSLPFYSYKQAKTIENALNTPIIDLTSGKEVPENDIIKVFHPDIMEVAKF